MTAYCTALLIDLRARCKTVWAEIPSSRVYEGQHVNQIAWASLKTPYAVLIVPKPKRTDDYSVDTVAYLVNPELYYVDAVNGPLTALRAQIEAMRDSLLATDLDTAQVIDIPAFGWDDDIEPNRLFAAEGIKFRAAMVEAEILLLNPL